MKLRLPSTLSVLYTLALMAAAWESFTIVNRTDGDTFSATIRRLGVAQPFIVFMSGMTMGHLFWPLTDGQGDKGNK